MSAEKMAEESAWEIGIECDIRPDRDWSEQWHCALHGAWFRSDDEPLLCPFGMGYVKGHAAGQVEEHESSKDAITAARAEGERAAREADPLVFFCVECSETEDGGYAGVYVDEDGCCTQCGNDAFALPESLLKRTGSAIIASLAHEKRRGFDTGHAAGHAAGVAEERERCKAIAERQHSDWELVLQSGKTPSLRDKWEGRRDEAWSIRDAIASGEKP